jgi:modification methylase
VLDDTSLQVTQSAKQQKRVPFGALVENGMLKPGGQLFGPARKVKARIRADGSLKLGTAKDAPTGSIHKIGATAQGLEACNGWTYWHYKEGDKLLPIDTLREKLRDLVAG